MIRYLFWLQKLERQLFFAVFLSIKVLKKQYRTKA